jgi:hypothetical protein
MQISDSSIQTKLVLSPGWNPKEPIVFVYHECEGLAEILLHGL